MYIFVVTSMEVQLSNLLDLTYQENGLILMVGKLLLSNVGTSAGWILFLFAMFLPTEKFSNWFGQSPRLGAQACI